MNFIYRRSGQGTKAKAPVQRRTNWKASNEIKKYGDAGRRLKFASR